MHEENYDVPWLIRSTIISFQTADIYKKYREYSSYGNNKAIEYNERPKPNVNIYYEFFK